jgi:hypothetical protein
MADSSLLGLSTPRAFFVWYGIEVTLATGAAPFEVETGMVLSRRSSRGLGELTAVPEMVTWLPELLLGK